MLVSLALGTGLRLAEIGGLDVGDVYLPGGQPRVRVRLRAEIAKRGRAGDVFLPDGLKPKLVRFWRHKVAERSASIQRPRSSAHAQVDGSRSGGCRCSSAGCRSRQASIASTHSMH